jgi:zinc protease
MATDSIVQSSVDGIPVVFAKLDGPVRAGLRFDVGAVDEPLARRGITHVVEHLVLSGLGSQPYFYNGEVAPTQTTFSVAGSMEQVEAFLAHVCRSLQELPVDRFIDELRVLTVEGSGHGFDQVKADVFQRFGAVGPGVLAWPEYGFHSVVLAEAQLWATRWFTRATGVLWLSAEPRSSLELSLPHGVPRSPREPSEVRFSGNGWVAHKTRFVSVSLVRSERAVPFAGSMGLEIARRRAFIALRTKMAVSYSVNALQLRIGGGQVLCQLAADARPESYQEALTELSTSLLDVCTNGPTEQELSSVQDGFRLMSNDPMATWGMLEQNATFLLEGEPIRQVQEVVEVNAQVTAANVIEALSPSLNALLAIGPPNRSGPPPGWRELEGWSSRSVTGDNFEAVEGQERGTLIVGKDGVTWRFHAGAVRTVYWRDCVACLCWDNGARRVIGRDGSAVAIAPWAWQNGDRLPPFVDGFAPPALRVHLDAASGPKPIAPTGSTVHATPAGGKRRRLTPWSRR